ncbi:MAG: hypothetical protein JOS17DRAFT_269604 [Linnemannia elongata]|nr:MAG: hypothetical protein JOS17DRAFT_269604 [Linnemannia elongata]
MVMEGIDHHFLVHVVLVVVYVQIALVDLTTAQLYPPFFLSLLFISLPFLSFLSFLHPLSNNLVDTPFTFFLYLPTLSLTLKRLQSTLVLLSLVHIHVYSTYTNTQSHKHTHFHSLSYNSHPTKQPHNESEATKECLRFHTIRQAVRKRDGEANRRGHDGVLQ